MPKPFLIVKTPSVNPSNIPGLTSYFYYPGFEGLFQVLLENNDPIEILLDCSDLLVLNLYNY
jgi:hypothetical protein